MKQRLFRKIFGLALTLAFALSLTACTPQIIINTGNTNETDTQTDTSTVTSQPVTEPSQKVEAAPESKEEKTQSKTSKNKTTSTPKKSSSSKSSSSKSSSTISKSKAKSIVLEHANVKSKDITRYNIHLDYDDGVTKYDISFYVDGKEYEYELSAKTGKILSYDKPKTSITDSKISKSKAKSIALKDAGVKSSDIHDYELELDIDNGVMKYEISFSANGYEYDYDINAKTGKIIRKDKERDD